MTNPIQFSLNGVTTTAHCRADMTVLEWLRGEALLRGTKEGCAEGDCGACSVLVQRAPTGKSKERPLPTNACILLMGQIEGASIVTVEGLAAISDAGHDVQQKMAANGSSQCGFCTPGIVVALAGLLDRNKDPKEADIHDALAGNLCRCTGYRPIVEAAHESAKAGRNRLPIGKPKTPENSVGSSDSEFLIPTSLSELLDVKKQHKKAVLLAGGTDLNLDVAHARARWPKAILTRHVAELREIEKSKTEIVFGGAVTWQEALPHLQKLWPSFATLVRRFGSVQIRSMGTIAGNLGTASPIGDGAPALLALGAKLRLASTGGSRDVPLEKFFLDYRKSALKPDEIIRSIHIPLPKRSHQFRVYKISKRYDQDISTVCGAFWFDMKGEKIADCRIAFGGMAAVPKRSISAEDALIACHFTDADVVKAKTAITQSFAPMSDMRGTDAYRSKVAANLLDRVKGELSGDVVEVMEL